jgi:hypothetical protein
MTTKIIQKSNRYVIDDRTLFSIYLGLGVDYKRSPRNTQADEGIQYVHTGDIRRNTVIQYMMLLLIC